MSRKDTILIAVFVNAALLVVLFVTAIKSDKKEVPIVAAKPMIEEIKPLPIPLPMLPPILEIKETQGDEIDQVLKEYTQKTIAHNQEETKEEQKIDFAKELQALTKAVAIPTETPKQESSSHKEVTVKKGDVLEKIARNNQTTVAKLIELNKLKNTNLRIGQVLKVPGKGRAEAVHEETTRVEPVSANSQYYTMKNGDNAWTVSVKNHMKLEDLFKLNDLNEEKARRLKPGDKLRIR